MVETKQIYSPQWRAPQVLLSLMDACYLMYLIGAKL